MILPWPGRNKRNTGSERIERFVLIDKDGVARVGECPFDEKLGLTQVLRMQDELDAHRWVREWNGSRIIPSREVGNG